MPTNNILLFDDEDIEREDADNVNDGDGSGQVPLPTSSRQQSSTTPNKASSLKGSFACSSSSTSVRPPSAFLNSSMKKMTNETRHDYFAEDIRASNRLHGYAFAGITCMVLLVSSNLWVAKKDDSEQFTVSGVKYCYHWKEIAAICFGAVGMTLSVLILVCHFDTMIAPKLWATVFIDGSRYEMILLRILLVIWAGGVYICTSSFSVGNVQLNVFFSSWLSFISLLYTYDNWRIGAGGSSYWRNNTEFPSYWTKYSKNGLAFNLATISFCSLVCFLSIMDLFITVYLTSPEVNFTEKYEDMSLQTWIISLSASGGTFFVSTCYLLLILKRESLPSCFNTNKALSQVAHGLQGIVLFTMVGVWAWALFYESNAFFHGVTNIYFSTWGTFFYSCFAFSSWLIGGSGDITIAT